MTRYKYKTPSSTKQLSLKMNNYCAMIYARTKSPQRHNVHTKAWPNRYMIIQVMFATENFCQGLSDNPCEFFPDTDSFMIGLDKHAKCCMENNVHNFVTKLTPTPNIMVRGVGNQLMEAKGKGTVLWKIEDDNGVVHDKLFPGTLYIPELKLCLLSPHYWCQSADDNFSRRDGTWQFQTADKLVMEWDQRKFRRTRPWDRRTNTGRMRSAPGTNHYRAFASIHDPKQECHKHEHVAYAHVIPDDRTGSDSERGKASESAKGEDNPLLLIQIKWGETSWTSLKKIRVPTAY
jgi:hypothetical protein